MRRVSFALIGVVHLLGIMPAGAYVRTAEVSGTLVKWPATPITFEINRRGVWEISDGSDFTATRAAFATWDAVPNSSLAFTDGGLSDNEGFKEFPSTPHNTVVWVDTYSSDPTTDLRVLPDVVANTMVYRDPPGSGTIVEADIILNAVQFSWTASGTGSYTTLTGPMDIQNVLTHEIGHFVGLDHVLTAGSAVAPYTYQGQISLRTLAQDEVSAVQFIYPSGTPAVESISGRVRRSSVGVPGAYVVAYQSGVPIVGALSGASGNYTIKPVSPGTYLLRIQPFTNSSIVSPYYRNSANVDVNFLSILYPSSNAGKESATEATPPSTAITVPSGGTVTGIDFDVSPTAAEDDVYEQDDTFSTAPATPIRKDGKAQIHHNWPAGDDDWVRLSATANCVYMIETRNVGFGTALSASTDTALQLYDQTGTTRLDTAADTESDNRNAREGDVSSRIVRKETATATRYIRVIQKDATLAGAGGYFDLAVTEICASFPTPTVTAVQPAQATQDGGIVVTVRGTAFMPGAQVRFGGVDGTQENVQECDPALTNCKAIRVVVPVHTQVLDQDLVAVDVTNPDGTTTSQSNAFTYVKRRIGTYIDGTGATLLDTIGHGTVVCWGDFDNDGDPDLFCPYENAAGTRVGELWRNNGNGTFTDITASAGLDTSATLDRQSCAWGDYDGDGDLDLYVVKGGVGGVDRLYRNNGNSTFTNVAAAAGVTGCTGGKGDAAWADYDLDGDLDLYLTCGTQGTPPRNQLFRNNGNGTFTDVAVTAHVDTTLGNRVLWADYDKDGYPDFYLLRFSLSQPDILFHNNRDGTFTNVTQFAGTMAAGNCYDAAWADFNNDKQIDLLCVLGSITGSLPQFLWLNQGNGTFVDQAGVSGINSLGRSATALTVLDRDNDGDIDAYLGCSDFAVGPDELDALLDNSGANPPVFTNVAAAAGADESAFPRNANAVACADVDGDHHMDILVTASASPFDDDAYLWRGTSNTNQSLTVRLEGTVTNTWGVGAEVTVISDLPGTDAPSEAECLSGATTAAAQRQEVIGGSHSQNSMELEFGLGSRPIDARQVDCVIVRWPRSGLRRVYTRVGTDQTLLVKEENDSLLVTRVTPSAGSPAGGTSVTVFGFMFTLGAQVYFDNVLATNIVYVSNSMITCTTPPHAPGVVDVRVENSPGVGSTLTGGFSYVNPGGEITLKLGKDVAQNKVKLSWTDVNQGAYYRVKRALGPRPADFSPAPFCRIVGGATFDDTFLNDGVTYYYLVDTTLTCP